MKKFVSIAATLLLAVFLFAGCDLGGYYETPGNLNGGHGSANQPTPDPIDETHYAVKLFYNSMPFKPGNAEITVVWQNDAEQFTAPLDSFGRADAGELDGDYDVHILGLPERYSYNPNGYHVTRQEPQADVIIVDVMNPVQGDGSNLYLDQGCYDVRYTGTYRAKCTAPNKYLYYEYTPTVSGHYSVQSWVDVYEDKINPRLEVYTGTAGWKGFPQKRDGGGAALAGGYTKNFRIDLYIEPAGLGRSYTFAVGADIKTGVYPVYVDFAIIREGEYDEDRNIEVVEPKELPEEAAAESSYAYYFADMTPKSGSMSGTKIFDGEFFRYNAATGVYHVYSEEVYPETNGYGPMLYCSIKDSPKCYTVTTLYEANDVGESGEFINVSYNFLSVTVWDSDTKSYVTRDYTDFVRGENRAGYANVCNSDGRCYVTKELKQFLQDYAEAHSLWSDNVIRQTGTPEADDYNATQDNMWLFACGFYESDMDKIVSLNNLILQHGA